MSTIFYLALCDSRVASCFAAEILLFALVDWRWYYFRKYGVEAKGGWGPLMLRGERGVLSKLMAFSFRKELLAGDRIKGMLFSQGPKNYVNTFRKWQFISFRTIFCVVTTITNIFFVVKLSPLFMPFGGGDRPCLPQPPPPMRESFRRYNYHVQSL